MFQTGLTLPKAEDISILPEINLLIVAKRGNDLQRIREMLERVSARLICQRIDPEALGRFSTLQQYDLIIYNYCAESASNSQLNSQEDPVTRDLGWWYKLENKIPLIFLAASPLGEQRAISLIRSGVSDYLTPNELNLLPTIVETVLAKAVSGSNFRLRELTQQVTKLEEQISSLQQENVQLQTSEANPDYFSHLNHELRSPLANILQFAKMLRDKLYGDLNPKQAEYIAGIITSSDHLFELINDYLDMAKIDANSEKLFMEKIAVEDICDAALIMLKGRAKEKELELILDLGQNVDFCYADSLRLKQILINLLSNAVKFTESGSVTLRVRNSGDLILFSVIDTGIGISPEDSCKLFKPFQQLNTHLNRKHKGTGLGLVLSRKLAQLHGGDITLSSQSGQGSCFTVSIPNVVE